MVINEHTSCRGVLLHHIAQRIQAREGVEVEAEDCIGLGNKRDSPVGLVLVDYNVAYARHPVQIVGVLVGHDARHRVTSLAQCLGPRYRRAHGIAIGVGVREYHHLLWRRLNQ